MDTDTPGRRTGPIRTDATRRLGACASAVVLVAGLLFGVIAGASAVAPAADAEGSGASAENQPCLDNVGITVVVDFQELGGGVNVRCAPGPITDGFDALTKAGISFQTAIRSSGFVCKVAGKPSDDPCINSSPGDAYWSYWIASRGGAWCYSNLGAGARTRPLPPGSVEGWSFSKDKQSTTNKPPRYTPPAAIAGQTPNPIPASDCDGAVPSPPEPGPPVTTPPTSPAGPGPAPATPGNGAAGGSGSVDSDGSGDAAGVPTTGVGSPSPDGSSMSSTNEAAADDPVAAEALGLVQTNEDGSTQALGEVDLASDGSGTASPVAFFLAGLAAIALGVTGVVIARRRRVTET